MQIIDPATGLAYFQKRRRRFNLLNQARELTFSCYRKHPFLQSERTQEWFRDALEIARKEFAFQIWAYVLMPDHVHLLVYPSQVGCSQERVARPESAKGVVQRRPANEDSSTQLAERFSQFLKAVKEPVARKTVKFLKANSPDWLERITVREGTRLRHRFWQPGGGYDRNVTETETLRAMIEYIHANPVRRGLVARPEEWEWSSARWYAGIRPVKIEMEPSVIAELT